MNYEDAPNINIDTQVTKHKLLHMTTKIKLSHSVPRLHITRSESKFKNQ